MFDKISLTFLFDSFKALLSRPVLSNSIILFSYGAVPATSRTRSRISFTRLPQRCTKQKLAVKKQKPQKEVYPFTRSWLEESLALVHLVTLFESNCDLSRHLNQ